MRVPALAVVVEDLHDPERAEVGVCLGSCSRLRVPPGTLVVTCPAADAATLAQSVPAPRVVRLADGLKESAFASALTARNGARSPLAPGVAERQVIAATLQSAVPRRRSRLRTTRLRVGPCWGASTVVGAGHPPRRAPIGKCPFAMQCSETRRTPSETGFVMVGRVGLEPTTR
jgi:hypothetical protein